MDEWLRASLPRDDDLHVDGISAATKTTLAYEKAMNEVINEVKKKEKKDNHGDFPGRDN